MIKQIRLGTEPLQNINDINSNFSTLDSSINALKPGQPGGVATLDNGGKLNKSQLPLIDAVPVEKRELLPLSHIGYELPSEAPEDSYCYQLSENKLYRRQGGEWLGPYEPMTDKLYIGPYYDQLYWCAGDFGLLELIYEPPNLNTLLKITASATPPYNLTYNGDPLMQHYKDYWTYKDIVKFTAVSGWPDIEGNLGDMAYDAAAKTLYVYTAWGWDEVICDSEASEYYPPTFADFIVKKPGLLFFDKENSMLYGFTADIVRDENDEAVKIDIELIPVS